MKIASFNAQRFGLRKALDPGILSTLIKVQAKAVHEAAAMCPDQEDDNDKYLTDWYL